MKKVIKKQINADHVEELMQKIFVTLDGSPLIESLLAIANAFAQIHAQEGLDIDMALDAVKGMYDQALEDNNTPNEVH